MWKILLDEGISQWYYWNIWIRMMFQIKSAKFRIFYILGTIFYPTRICILNNISSVSEIPLDVGLNPNRYKTSIHKIMKSNYRKSKIIVGFKETLKILIIQIVELSRVHFMQGARDLIPQTWEKYASHKYNVIQMNIPQIQIWYFKRYRVFYAKYKSVFLQIPIKYLVCIKS